MWKMGFSIEYLLLWKRRIRHQTKSHDHHLTSLRDCSAMTQLAAGIDVFAHQNMHVWPLRANCGERDPLEFDQLSVD